MIYADTSALVKLIYTEPESDALREWLTERPNVRVGTNRVGIVELRRFAARIGPETSAAAVQLVTRLDRIDVTATAWALAVDVPPPVVRTLDALHIASAAELPDLTAFLTYDRRLAAAARSFGLPVVAPGADEPA